MENDKYTTEYIDKLLTEGPLNTPVKNKYEISQSREELMSWADEDRKKYWELRWMNKPVINPILECKIKDLNSNIDRISIEVHIINRNASEKLINFKIPIESCLYFKNTDTNEVVNPYWPFLASGTNSGNVVKNGDKMTLILDKIRNSKTKTKFSIDEIMNSQIDIFPGKWLAVFELSFDKDFFDGFSHRRYKDCLEESKTLKVDLWEGRVYSNVIEEI